MKEKIISVWRKLWQNLAEYKITMIFTMLWMVFAIIHIFTDNFYRSWNSENSVLEAVNHNTLAASEFMILLATAILLCEIALPKKYIKWLFILLPSAALSGILVCNNCWDKRILGISDVRGTQLMAGYVLLLLLLILYFSFRKSVQPFFTYAPMVFLYLMVACAIWLILYLGVFAIFGIIDSLLFDLEKICWDWETVLLVFLTGCCLIPFCLTALSSAEKEDTREQISSPILRVIIKYLLTGISIGILCICYLYMLKILILREIPSNEIFTDVTALFCIGAPMWLASENYKTESLYSKFIGLLPYLMIPLIGLQAWSLGLRINQYGLTPERYIGIAFILFEVGFVLLWKWFHQSFEKLLLIAAALVTVSFLLPFVNMNFLSIKNQEHFLRLYTEKRKAGEALTELEMNRMIGSYDYLVRCGSQKHEYYVSTYGDFIEQSQIAQEEKKEIRHSFHACQMVEEIELQGYQTFHMLNQSNRYTSVYYDDPLDIDFTHFRFYKRGSEEQNAEVIEADLSGVWEQILAYETKNRDYDKKKDSAFLKQRNRIEINENQVLYLNHFEVNYYTIDDQVSNITTVNISGMLLEK